MHHLTFISKLTQVCYIDIAGWSAIHANIITWAN